MAETEKTYTLNEAALELQRRECARHGHSWEVMANLVRPFAITCACGTTYRIVKESE